MLEIETVKEIFTSCEKSKVLSLRYNVSQQTINDIRSRRTHANITDGLLNCKERIYEFSGSTSDLEQFNVSRQQALNIKFNAKYEHLGEPGELLVHKLTWDDVCSIRSSVVGSARLAKIYKVTVETINNIKSGRTRMFK